MHKWTQCYLTESEKFHVVSRKFPTYELYKIGSFLIGALLWEGEKPRRKQMLFGFCSITVEPSPANLFVYPRTCLMDILSISLIQSS